jgi:hypothetical protein
MRPFSVHRYLVIYSKATRYECTDVHEIQKVSCYWKRLMAIFECIWNKNVTHRYGRLMLST